MRIRAALAVALVSSAAFADDQLNGIGDTYWSVGVAIGTTTQCVPRYAGQTICALFPAGDAAEFRNRVTMIETRDTAVTCAWTGYVGRVAAEDATNGIDLDASTFNVDDNALTDCGPSGSAACAPNGDGAGSVVRAELPAVPQQERKTWNTLRKALAGGFRPGVCSNAITGRNASGEDKIHAPCNRNSDCTNYGGGTCLYDSQDSFISAPYAARLPYVGMFLLCECSAGTCNVTVKKQSIPR